MRTITGTIPETTEGYGHGELPPDPRSDGHHSAVLARSAAYNASLPAEVIDLRDPATV